MAGSIGSDESYTVAAALFYCPYVYSHEYVVFIYECQPCADSVGFDTIMHIASILSKGRDIPVPREKGRGILPLDYPREVIFRFLKIQGK